MRLKLFFSGRKFKYPIMCLRTGSGPGLQDTIHNPDLEAGGRLFQLEIFTNRDKITAARHAAVRYWFPFHDNAA